MPWICLTWYRVGVDFVKMVHDQSGTCKYITSSIIPWAEENIALEWH